MADPPKIGWPIRRESVAELPPASTVSKSSRIAAFGLHVMQPKGKSSEIL
jgi:hypothetical protein